MQNTPGSPTDLIESGWVMGGPDLKVGVQNTPDLCRHLRPRAVWVIERLGQYQTYGYWHLNWGGWSRHMGNGPASMEAHRIESPFAQVPTSDIPGNLLLDSFQ